MFIGPGVILTNDRNPRAITASEELKNQLDWEIRGVVIEKGASIGAGSVCIAPVRVGRWAMVAAGSVVTMDIPPFSLVAGIPARRLGWVGKSGFRLEIISESQQLFRCPKTGELYSLQNDALFEVVN